MTEYRHCDRCGDVIDPSREHFEVTAAHGASSKPARHLCADCAGWVFRPTDWMHRVSLALEQAGRPLSKRELYHATGAMTGNRADKQGHITDAIAHLEDRGHIKITPGPRGAALHTLIKPYRAGEEITTP